MGFQLDTELDASVDPRPPTLLAFPIANLAAPGAIGGTTPAAGAFTTIDASGAVALASTLDVNGATSLDGATSITATATLATSTKLQLRDAGIFLNSSVDGQADFDADGEIEITTPSLDINVTGTDISGTLVVGGAATFTAGSQNTPVPVTATVDGLTTGLIPTGTAYVTVTAGGDANSIITLPTAVVGNKIRGYIGATGCEIRTPAASNATINGQDSDGTKEAAIPATTLFELTCVAADTWILVAWDELGAAIAAIVPD